MEILLIADMKHVIIFSMLTSVVTNKTMIHLLKTGTRTEIMYRRLLMEKIIMDLLRLMI